MWCTVEASVGKSNQKQKKNSQLADESARSPVQTFYEEGYCWKNIFRMYVTIQNELHSWCAGNKTSCRTEETIDIAKRFPERNNAPKRTTNWNNGVAKGGYNKNYEPRTHCKKTDESQSKPKRQAKYLKCADPRHTPNYVKKMQKVETFARLKSLTLGFFMCGLRYVYFAKSRNKCNYVNSVLDFFSKLLG